MDTSREILDKPIAIDEQRFLSERSRAVTSTQNRIGIRFMLRFRFHRKRDKSSAVIDKMDHHFLDYTFTSVTVYSV